MDRLFGGSRLYRTKWDERHGAQTYGAMTLAAAIAGCAEVYYVDHRSPAALEKRQDALEAGLQRPG